MKKITRKALLTAKLYRPGKAGGGATHQIKKLDPAPAEYIEAGSQKHTYVHEPSGSYMSVVTRPTGKRSASVTDLFVPEEHRNKGIAKALQSRVMQDFPSLQGQVSSKIAAKNAYAAGRRLAGNEDASLDDIYRAIDENSSANLWTLKAAGGRTGYADGGSPDDEGFDAYHGSPHEFDAFDLSRVGSGEGAQKYGHGAYLADQELVGKGYRDRLALNKNQFKIVDKRTGEEISPDTLGYPLVNDFLKTYAYDLRPGDVKHFTDDIVESRKKGELKAIKDYEDTASGNDPRIDADTKNWLLEEAARMRANLPHYDAAKELVTQVKAQPVGHMYHFRVNAPKEKLIDWDKPLSEQHPVVQAVLGSDPGKTAGQLLEPAMSNPQHAGALIGKPSATKAELSAHLLSKGIPGIQYLDEGSRYLGRGSKNYVIFDDKALKLKRRYAMGGMPRTGYADGGTPSRYVDPNNFYSKAHHEARKLTQKKGSPQQMRAMLEKAGVKPEEIAQSGYDEAFAGRPSVTSDEVASHFHQKRPNLKVERFFSPEHAEYEPEIDDETRFDRFTLHGQTNYREHLLRLPPKEGEPFFTEDMHWPDYKNVVAHIRMGDRGTPIDRDAAQAVIEKMKADDGITRFIGADPSKWASGAADFALERGTINKQEAQALSRYRRWNNDAMRSYVPERNLHVEEIQSDWAQKGRKQGFDDPNAPEPRTAQQHLEEYRRFVDGLREPFVQQATQRFNENNPNADPENRAQFDRMMAGITDDMHRNHGNARLAANALGLGDEHDRLLTAWATAPITPKSLPRAPFVTSTPGWTNLALKHILTEAVKGRYDRIVLSPGQANADMYSGLDEKQQNGLRSFYDQVLPTQMNKLVKSLDPDHPGMQMFSHTLPPVSGSDDTEGYKGHALDITPDLRDAVNKGLPMFKRGGEVEGEGGEDTPAQNAADHIALLLREGRAKEVTDDLMGQADPKRLYEHYESGNTGMQMPMDEDSRMDRAKALGFDVKAYRGQTGDPGASLNTVRTEGKTAGTGAWATSDPDIAATYSGRENPVSIPLVIKSGEYQTHDFGGNFWGDGPEGKTTDELARASNAPGVQFKNITDVGPHLWNRANVQKRIPEMADSFAIKDPKTVRARFARFDPRLAHLSHLSAATGGAISEQTNDGGVNRNLVNGTNLMVTKALALARNLTRR